MLNIRNRVETFSSYLERGGMDAAVIMLPDHQYYLTGFKALIYSRPIFLIINKERSTLVVPGLEELHAGQSAQVEEVKVYYEHPEESQTQHMSLVESVVKGNAKGSTIGLDFANAPTSLYQALTYWGYQVKDVGQELVRMRYVKEEEEIAMMKKAGELVNLALETSLKACVENVSELEVDAKGNAALYAKASRDYPGSTLDTIVMSPSGKERTILPHVFSNTRRFQNGDGVIHSRQVALNGYRAELERTIFIGKPNDDQQKMFDLATKAQKMALDFIKPGVSASDVDQVTRNVFQKAGVADYAVHRTGHGLGISAHEEPYIRFDSDLLLEEGMVFCVEPGIYIPGIGGFRHSDTVILRKNGAELITHYPTAIDSLTFA
ncbi:Xaa-Pro peptidase family protein [Fictibacillus enclensis]|uniref:M24 family metallopeptidase n=1 Tax=Fictibacillus enclensis TaxID=1017270 RepID=UPI0025A3054D|nr:Xaa-Pro peptidase family protein [Fictibacillus enclensis]MDM5196675.1 Xaa-Pro peptidase family protein [Fictibacillus enclensis]